MNLEELSNKISDNLSINRDIILNILREKGVDLSLEISNEKINSLLQVDLELKEFGETLKSDTTKELYQELKQELGKLQMNHVIDNNKIINKLKSSPPSKIVEEMIDIFKNKIETVNNILKDNLTQTGGNYYLVKYKKYKKKYINLKSKLR
jgi:hypothetical protein